MSTDVSPSVMVTRPSTISTTSPQGFNYWNKKENSSDKTEKEDEEPEIKTEDQEAIDRYNIRTVMESESPPSSENSNSYEWSFEEQFKQLYELDQEEGRKEFLDDFFEFMKRRGTPVNRIPIMAKQILDLFQLYNLVVKHGGLVQVIRNKQWSKITKGLNLPSSITSAAFTLRTQYLKYLYPYECAMHGFSTPKELQAAIDSNRRDRFSSLYHTDNTMNTVRDDCYAPFAVSGCDYTTLPHPHSSLAGHPFSPADQRFGIKRHLDIIPGKHYEAIQQEGTKVIILPEGATSCPDDYIKKGAGTLRQRSKSPLSGVSEVEVRKYSELESIRNRHFALYGNKDWDGDIRHVLQEDGRSCHFPDGQGIICKGKNCSRNGCPVQISDQDPRNLNGPYISQCPCSYCKEYTKGTASPQTGRFMNSEAHRPMPRHHMEGASALNRERPSIQMLPGLKGSPSPPKKRGMGPEDHERQDMLLSSAMQIKLQDVNSSSDKSIRISIEVNGNRYEGVLYQARRESTHLDTQSRES